MFAVKRVEMVNKTFRMSVDLVKRLSIVAQAQDVSMNNLVSQCCEYALDNMAANKKVTARDVEE
ncbi:MAG: toxin-antitoxin system HicB family antitoxin [Selenomonadaceae bacterium]|nr:toxin-antitoxin system HicB family antitoxin [Selenomonadaceae bacterium]